MDAEAIALSLRQASISCTPISPISKIIGTDDMELAYLIQNINNNIKINSGLRVTGKKIGLTSKAVQQQLGVDQPDFGILFQDMELANGSSIDVDQLMQPKVEAEIAFVLSQDIDSENISTTELINAIDYVIPTIEIVASRIKDWNIKITDTIADNASASHYVLGNTPQSIDDIDMVACKMQMSINDRVVSEGAGASCMGSPLNALHWLATKMCSLGSPLLKGEIVLSGALGKFVDVRKGDKVKASITGLGSVSVNFK